MRRRKLPLVTTQAGTNGCNQQEAPVFILKNIKVSMSEPLYYCWEVYVQFIYVCLPYEWVCKFVTLVIQELNTSFFSGLYIT